MNIKIYRCWLMWGKQLLVVSVPLILAWLSFGKRSSIPFDNCFPFKRDGLFFILGVSLATIGALVEPSASSRIPGAFRSWLYPLGTAAYSVSISVNAIVASLLAVKIYENQRKAKIEQKDVKVNPIRAFISILNDSGMMMLGCQIIWLTLFRLNSIGFVLARGPIVMIYVRTPSLPSSFIYCCY